MAIVLSPLRAKIAAARDQQRQRREHYRLLKHTRCQTERNQRRRNCLRERDWIASDCVDCRTDAGTHIRPRQQIDRLTLGGLPTPLVDLVEQRRCDACVGAQTGLFGTPFASMPPNAMLFDVSRNIPIAYARSIE